MKAIDLDAEGRRRLLASLSFDPGMAHWLVGADTALCMHLAQDLALMGPRLASGRPRRRFAGLRGAAPGVNAVFGMETLFPELSVLDNLFIGRPVHWRRPAELIARAREAFAVLGSDLQPEGSARDLSDLQRQSLALARAILTPAPLTVIHCEPDEPVVAAQLNRAGRHLLRQRDVPVALVVLARSFVDLPWVTHLHGLRAGQWVYSGPAESDWRTHWAVATAVSRSESEAVIQRSLKRMQDAGRGGALAFAQDAMSLGRVCLRTAVLHCVFLDRMGQLVATDSPQQALWMAPARELLARWRLPGAGRRSELLDTPAGRFMALPLIGKGGTFGLLLAGPSPRGESRDQGVFVQVFGRVLGEALGEEMLDLQLAHVRRLDTLGAMAGGLVHDFNNTLYVIDSAARLASNPTSEDDTRRQLRVIRQAVQQAGALTSKLRSFGQRQGPQPVALDMHEVVLDAVTLLRVAAGSTVQIDCELTAETSAITGDASALVNMVVNLGMNAVHALGEGSRHIMVRTSSHAGPSSWINFEGERQRGGFFELEMADSGCGMDAPTMARLFEPFFTTRAAAGGTGLGLATVIQAVRQHGGAIDVTSAPGEGTTVRLRFPVAIAMADDPTVAPAADARGRPDSAAARALQVLVCDDDDLTRELLTDMLQLRGMHVTAVADARACLQRYAQSATAYDVVILDYRMPGMTGEECFRELKRLDPEVRAVLLSGHPGQANTAELLAMGLHGVFQKPIEAQTLVDSITAAATAQDAFAPLHSG